MPRATYPGILIFTEGCSNCSVSAARWTLRELGSASRDLPAIQFLSGDPDFPAKLAGQLRSEKGTLPSYYVVVLRDYDSACRRYNVQRFPRAYILGVKGEIVHCQDGGESPAKLAIRAAGLAKARKGTTSAEPR